MAGGSVEVIDLVSPPDRGGVCEADCIIIDDDSPAVAHNRRASKRARRAEPVEDDADDVVIVFDGGRADGGASGAAGARGGARAASGAAAAAGGSWRNRDTRRGGGAGGPRLEDGDLALARRMQEQEKQLAERASAEAARHLAHTLQQHSPPGGRGGFGSMLFGGDEYSGFGGGAGAGAGAGAGPARRRGGGMFGGEDEDFWTSRLPWGHHGGGGGAGAGRFTPFSGVSNRAAHHAPPHGGGRGGGRHYHHHHGGGGAAAAMPVPGGLPAQLAFVDRDFGPDDYETLLALDERIAAKKGVSTRELERHTSLTVVTPSSPLDLTGDDAAAAVAASSKETKECAVCLDVPSLGQCVRRLRCMHVFHADCIDTWLKTSRTCPVCKADVAPPREEKGKKERRR